MNYWLKKFDVAMDAFTELKSMTKKVPASTWTPEYRALAEHIHTMGRDHFHNGVVKDMYREGLYPKNPQTGQPEKPKPSPVEVAYAALGKVLAFFPNCPLCGRAMPGHHTPDCDYLSIYDEVRRERGELDTFEASDSTDITQA